MTDKLDKLDDLILHVFRNAGARGLTDKEATEQVVEYVARSNDPELQALADADPGFKHWRNVKLPAVTQ